MRWRIAGAICRKELLESLRDRRTLFVMVLMPVLVYPVLMLGLSRLTDAEEAAGEARPSRVALWGAVPPELAAQLKASKDLRMIPPAALPASLGAVKPPPVRNELDAPRKRGGAAPQEPDHAAVLAARPLLLKREVEAVVLVWPGLGEALESDGLGDISVLYDSVREDSERARERLARQLRAYRKAAQERREKQRGLAPGFSKAIEFHDQNVASSSRRAGRFLGSLLPFMLVAMTITAGFYSAIDLTAGEKERGTMQTLLCAPLRPSEIIAGKFLAVWAIALMGSLANITSFAATFARITLPGGAVHASPWAYVLAFLMLAPVSCMVTALYLAVAVMARDFKDGQNYLTPVMMGMMMPMAVTMLPGIELNAWTSFVPLINIALLIKALFLGEAGADAIFLTGVASIAYAVLPLLFAARVFARENVLLGGREPFSALFSSERKGERRPSASLGLVMFAAVLVVAFYGSLALHDSGIAVMILATEFGFFLLPVVAVTAGLRFPFAETLGLRLPPWRGVAAAVLVGVSAWAAAAGVLVRLLPPPESLRHALERIILLDHKAVPLWVLWLVIGLAPALCEEIFFRGFLFSAFCDWGKWPAILVSALLFGFAHASIYRLLPTLFLGLVFGYVVWQTRSVACGIIAHALNNGLMATLAQLGPGAAPGWMKGATYLPWSLTLAGAALTAAGLWIASRSARPGHVNIEG